MDIKPRRRDEFLTKSHSGTEDSVPTVAAHSKDSSAPHLVNKRGILVWSAGSLEDAIRWETIIDDEREARIDSFDLPDKSAA
jgi:hypothetical protein